MGRRTRILLSGAIGAFIVPIGIGVHYLKWLGVNYECSNIGQRSDVAALSGTDFGLRKGARNMLFASGIIAAAKSHSIDSRILATIGRPQFKLTPFAVACTKMPPAS